MCLIWQTKCPICGLKWLEGFWIPSTYDRDRAYQSCYSNCDSPCSKEWQSCTAGKCVRL